MDIMTPYRKDENKRRARIARREKCHFCFLAGTVETEVNASEFKALYPYHWQQVFNARGNYFILGKTWIRIMER